MFSTEQRCAASRVISGNGLSSTLRLATELAYATQQLPTPEGDPRRETRDNWKAFDAWFNLDTNLLPDRIVISDTVRAFQTVLSYLLKHTATSGYDSWPDVFSCRVEYWRHPLRRNPI